MRRLSTKSPPLRTLPTRAYLICLLAVTKPEICTFIGKLCCHANPRRTTMKDGLLRSLAALSYLSLSLFYSYALSTSAFSVSSMQRSQWALPLICRASSTVLVARDSVGKREFPWFFEGLPGEISFTAKQLDEIRRGSRSGILSAAFSWITTLFVLLCDPDEFTGESYEVFRVKRRRGKRWFSVTVDRFRMFQ